MCDLDQISELQRAICVLESQIYTRIASEKENYSLAIGASFISLSR